MKNTDLWEMGNKQMKSKIPRILTWEKFGSQCREEFKERLANYLRCEDRAENLQRIRQLEITGKKNQKGERVREREISHFREDPSLLSNWVLISKSVWGKKLPDMLEIILARYSYRDRNPICPTNQIGKTQYSWSLGRVHKWSCLNSGE